MLLAVGGFVLVTIAAIALYLTFADRSRFRPQVEAAVSKAAGREFRIAGDFKPKVFPRPSFVATEVTLANAEWGAPDPDDLDRPRVRRDRALVAAVRADQDQVARSARRRRPARARCFGRRQLGDRARAPSAPVANTEWQGLPLIIELASVGNVTAIWRQPGADDFPTTLATLRLRTDESRTIVVEAGGQVREVPFTVNGSIVKVDANRARVELDGSFAETTIRAAALAA